MTVSRSARFNAPAGAIVSRIAAIVSAIALFVSPAHATCSTYQTAAHRGANGGTSIGNTAAVVIPGAVLADDICVVTISWRGTQTMTSVPAAWVGIDTATYSGGGQDLKQASYWGKAWNPDGFWQASSTQTFGLSGAVDKVWLIECGSGIDTTAPVDQHAPHITSDLDPLTDPVTTTVANDLIVSVAANITNGHWTSSTSTERWQAHLDTISSIITARNFVGPGATSDTFHVSTGEFIVAETTIIALQPGCVPNTPTQTPTQTATPTGPTPTPTATPTVTPTGLPTPANWCCQRDVPHACGPPMSGINCGAQTPIEGASCNGGTGSCETFTPTPSGPTATPTPMEECATTIHSVCNEGLFFHYRLDEPSGEALDDIGPTQSNGGIDPAVTWGQSGALTGDANTAADVTGAPWAVLMPESVYTTGQASVAVWVNTGSSAGGVIAQRSDLFTGLVQWQLRMADDGKIHWSVGIGSSCTLHDTAAPIPVNTGSYHLVVATYKATTGTAVLYIDNLGSVTNVINPTGALLCDVRGGTDTTWTFIHNQPPGGDGFSGVLDELLICAAHTITQPEVVNLFDVCTGISTPTPTPIATPLCTGDCNGDGVVAPDELGHCVNIMGGSENLSVCPACDTDSDGDVFVSEVTLAVRYLSEGCPGQPTPAPVRCCGDLDHSGTVDPAEVTNCAALLGPPYAGQIPVYGTNLTYFHAHNTGTSAQRNGSPLDCDCERNFEYTVVDATRIALNQGNGCAGPTPAPTLPARATNPIGTRPIVNGQLQIQPDGSGRNWPSMRVQVLPADPATPADGAVWWTLDHHCYHASGQTHCVPLYPIP